jgi:hypothetical protein
MKDESGCEPALKSISREPHYLVCGNEIKIFEAAFDARVFRSIVTV